MVTAMSVMSKYARSRKVGIERCVGRGRGERIPAQAGNSKVQQNPSPNIDTAASSLILEEVHSPICYVTLQSQRPWNGQEIEAVDK